MNQHSLSDNTAESIAITPSNIVNVAVAVIHYQGQFLLGYRQAHQHQGDRYEFVGGKIEPYETAQQAIIREVAEEIGSDISENLLVKMGVIRHQYADKSVALHIFKIEFTLAQYIDLQCAQGNEGQAITWISQADLLSGRYPLPAANARILDWLTLPEIIIISQPLMNFAHSGDWISFYQQRLAPSAIFYIRPQITGAELAALVATFADRRPDVQLIMPYQAIVTNPDLAKLTNLCAIHLNHWQLMNATQLSLQDNANYFVSCHDKISLSKANELAKRYHILGCFLSPILPTPTHPEESGLGWETFATLAVTSDIPVYALGGMDTRYLMTVQQHYGYGIAGIRLLN